MKITVVAFGFLLPCTDVVHVMMVLVTKVWRVLRFRMEVSPRSTES